MTVDERHGRQAQIPRVDLRPVVWDATVGTPREDRGVTIVLRVRYRTLEEICLDMVAVTASEAGAALTRAPRSSRASSGPLPRAAAATSSR